MRPTLLLLMIALAGCALGPGDPSEPPCGMSANSYYKWTLARDQGLSYAAVRDNLAIAESAGQAMSVIANESLAERKARAADIEAMSKAQKWIYAHPKLSPVEIQDATLEHCGV